MKFKYLLAILAFISTILAASASYATSGYGITAPAYVYKGSPVNISVQAFSLCVGYHVNWGDGYSTKIRGVTSFPHSPPAHIYTTTGRKSISILASSLFNHGCTGFASTRIEVIVTPKGVITPISKMGSIGRISGARFTFKKVNYRIKVKGNGRCKLRVKWGDGMVSIYPYNFSAPTYLSHKYYSTGAKSIRVTSASRSCLGSAVKSVEVKRIITDPSKQGYKKIPGGRRF